MMSDILEPVIDQAIFDSSPHELVEIFDSYLASQDKSDDTRRIYTYMLAKFFNWLGDIPYDRVNASDVLRWRADLMNEYKPLTVATHFAAVRNFYDYILNAGIIKTNPFVGIKVNRGTQKTTQKLTHKEWLALLATCEGNSAKDIRDRAIMVLGYELALRGVEILDIAMSDFDVLHGRRILWVRTRGDIEKEDYMIIPDSVGKILDEWLSVRGPETGPLFFFLVGDQKKAQLSKHNLYTLWRVRKEAAGISGNRKTFLSLRQTAIHNRARYAVKHGKSIYLVQAFARHKSPRATLTYFPEVDKSEDPPELWDCTPEDDYPDC